MTFVDDRGAGALLHRPGPPLQTGRSSMTVLAPPSATAGRYSLYRFDLQPRSGGPGPHLHRTFAESFVVLDGEVELYDGVRWSVGRPSDHLLVPEGVVHAFRHTTDEPASLLLVSTPAVPREDYFEELAALLGSGRDATLEELLDLWARHDTYPPPS